MSVHEAAEPCWTMDCDSCGDHLGSDEYSSVHYPNKGEAEQSARDYDWVLDGDMWFCETCAAQRSCANLGHVPDIKDSSYCTRCDDTIDPEDPPTDRPSLITFNGVRRR